MANRDGEFVLVFEPRDPDGHLVSSNLLHAITLGVTEVVQSGYDILNLSPDHPGNIELFHTASPEYGSVRFHLVAAVKHLAKPAAVVGAGLTVLANLSQISGQSLAHIWEAAARLAPASGTKPPETSGGLAANVRFQNALDAVVSVASDSGYNSIRIETPEGYKIELKRDQAMQLDDRRDRLTREITHLESILPDLQARHEAGNQTVGRNVRYYLAELNRAKGQLEETERQIAAIGGDPDDLDDHGR